MGKKCRYGPLSSPLFLFLLFLLSLPFPQVIFCVMTSHHLPSNLKFKITLFVIALLHKFSDNYARIVICTDYVGYQYGVLYFVFCT